MKRQISMCLGIIVGLLLYAALEATIGVPMATLVGGSVFGLVFSAGLKRSN